MEDAFDLFSTTTIKVDPVKLERDERWAKIKDAYAQGDLGRCQQLLTGRSDLLPRFIADTEMCLAVLRWIQRDKLMAMADAYARFKSFQPASSREGYSRVTLDRLSGARPGFIIFDEASEIDPGIWDYDLSRDGADGLGLVGLGRISGFDIAVGDDETVWVGPEARRVMVEPARDRPKAIPHWQMLNGGDKPWKKNKKRG